MGPEPRFDEPLIHAPPAREVARPRRSIAPILGAAAAGLALLLLAFAVVHARWLDRPIDEPAAAWAPLAAEPSPDPSSPPEAEFPTSTPPPASTVSIAAPGPAVAAAVQDEPALPPRDTPAIDPAAREASEALDRLIAESQADDALAAAVPEPAAGDPGVGRSDGPSAPPAARFDELSPRELTSPASAGIRVFIHYASTDLGNAAVARRLAEHLGRAGFTVAGIRPVDFPIEQPSVRYFFEDDRRASQRLVDVLARFFDGTRSLAPDRASDFTHHTPKPRAGNVEVWLRTS